MAASTILVPSADGTTGILRRRTLAITGLFLAIFCRVIMPATPPERNESARREWGGHGSGFIFKNLK